jgi:hypothetical protein
LKISKVKVQRSVWADRPRGENGTRKSGLTKEWSGTAAF